MKPYTVYLRSSDSRRDTGGEKMSCERKLRWFMWHFWRDQAHLGLRLITIRKENKLRRTRQSPHSSTFTSLPIHLFLSKVKLLSYYFPHRLQWWPVRRSGKRSFLPNLHTPCVSPSTCKQHIMLLWKAEGLVLRRCVWVQELMPQLLFSSLDEGLK